VTTNCYYEGPTGPYPLGRIVWEGTLGPDFGVTDPAVAVNDITITFSVTVASGINSVLNVATIDADLNGDGDVTDNGEQNVAQASAVWKRVIEPPKLPPALPATGFAPGRVTDIGNAPAGAYDASGDLRLVIPSLRVNIPIVGVPLDEGGWDVTWLWSQAGWLEGSAYPTLSGNSALTAHVYDANGLPGPFVNLGSLKWGDRIIVFVNGQQYVYEVRSNVQVQPNNMNVLKHEEKAWLTLVTCKQYDEASNTYKKRVVVRAVLVNVLSGAPTTGK
jgi:LPXTG-site transpeptidase (sortase) family protein